MLDYLIPYLTRTFSFDPNSPLLFTQFYFWGFFAVVFAFLTLVKNRILLRNAFLFATSMFFYYKTSGSYVCILVFCVIANFFIGKWIERAEEHWKKKLWMIIIVIIDLLVLCYYKYSYFFLDALYDFTGIELHVYNFFAAASNKMFGTNSLVDTIILPVGISFFTFQAISYCIDIYRGKISAVKNILDFGFYLTFFPQLVAGPIVRADKFVPQLYRKYFLPRRTFGIAVFWILNGLAKKIILSDYLATNFVDRVFDTPLLFTGLENLIALFAYSLQVYADFSGYTDIAIGVAMLMGFYLPLNFNSPYKATNAAGFWKRWHISLSNWLKDYLYIPLGGNRNSTPGTFIIPTVMLLVVVLMAKNLYVTAAAVALVVVLAIVYAVAPRHRKEFATNLNNFDTMLLGGMWHGASFNFITWGALNGLGILVYKWWKKKGPLYRIIAIALIYVGVKCLYHFFPIPVLSMFHFALMVTAAAIILLNLVPFVAGRRYRESKFKHGLNTVWNTFLTFIFISFTRLFFRSGSNLDPAEANETAWRTATQMVERIGGHWNWQQVPDILANYAPVFIVFLIGMIIHWLPDRFKRRYRLWFAAMPLPVMLLAVVLTVFIVYQFITADLQPFIYFQF